MLYQLVYKSVRNSNCDENEIQKILDSCKRNNPSKDITGVLLHTENNFIQYIEGKKDIIELYDLIKEDKRHSRVVLLSYGMLKERIFPSWHMGYKNIPLERINFMTDANQHDKVVFDSIMRGEKQTDTSATELLVKFFKNN